MAGRDSREGPASVAPEITSCGTRLELGGRYAGLRFSVCEVQRRIRENHDGREAGKGETHVPQVQGSKGGTCPERFLRQNQTKKLTAQVPMIRTSRSRAGV